MEELEKIPPENRIYMDESGVDEMLYRQYGRAIRGEKVLGEIAGKRTNRISMIAARNQGNVNIWVKKCLAPCLKPGQVLIYDNASFHKSSQMKKVVESCGGKILPLPTYSPDLNSIEHYWATTKVRIRKYRKPEQNLEEILDEVLCMS